MNIKLRTCLITIPVYLVATSAAFAADDLTQERENIEMGASLLNTIAAALPESTNVNAAYLDSAFDPNIRLSESAHVGISFIDEGAGYRNSFGYFTFSDGAFDGLNRSNIDTNGSNRVSLSELQSLSGVNEVGFIFNNASERGGGGSLQTGDSVVLGGGSLLFDEDGMATMSGGTVFEAGTNVGFFLGANTFNGSGVTGWDTEGDPNIYYSVDFLNPEAGASATVDDADELARHLAMGFADDGHTEIIAGFEDLDRRYGSDDDFNDLVFRIWTDPVTAIEDNNIDGFYTYAAPAPVLGQGAVGLIMMAGSLSLWRRKKNST